jgi:hypothetical protein
MNEWANLKTIRYDDLVVVNGSWDDIGEPLLAKLINERGFIPLLCCGFSRGRLIAVFHPARVKVGQTVECPRCRTIHTARELRGPDPHLEGATRAFLRPDGTYVPYTIDDPPN